MRTKIFLIISATLLLEVFAQNIQNRQHETPRGNAFRRRWRRNAEPKCILPPQPANGEYKVTGGTVINGKAAFINLQYSCNPSFAMIGEPGAFCWGGVWNAVEMPRCVLTCKLMKHRSMQYNCIISGTEATRSCKDTEVEGTVVQPTCKKPHYYTPLELPYMVCRQGSWNVWPTCIPECGLLTPKEATPEAGGASRFSDIPWHAAIYYKNTIAGTHEHVCSGSLISNSVVLSAAHCFWEENLKRIRDETNYAVAVAKLYSDWNSPDDEQNAQKSDVKKIAVPKQFRGAETDYQDNIAVVVVSRSFEYQLYVRPVCLDFRHELLEKQLKSGSVGKSAGWRVSDNEVSDTKMLQAINMPFISHNDCKTNISTEDKFCAGNISGDQALCGSDSGSGIAFPATIQNTTRFYLRGIAFNSATNDRNHCNTSTIFVAIAKYQNLIKRYWFL